MSGGGPTVLYIGGWGRSGSTLVDRSLGQVTGVVAVGELREIWQRGCVENRPCGCGQAFADCPFWTEVGRAAFGGWGELDLPSVLRLRYDLDRGWNTPRLLIRRRSLERDPRVREYARILGSLYGAIGDVAGATVVVDSGKLPSHALLASAVPGLDVRVVHLVRDSRGVAFSWQKQMRNPTGAGADDLMEQYGPLSSAARYLFYNELTTLAASGVPSLRVRYEDFVADPRPALQRILRHAGVQDADLGFVGGTELLLQPNHSVDGNPMRFSVGATRLRVDDEWTRAMSPADRTWVTALTFPLLLAYGYPLRGAARQPARSAAS
jgi:hypothetical protein